MTGFGHERVHVGESARHATSPWVLPVRSVLLVLLALALGVCSGCLLVEDRRDGGVPTDAPRRD
jgi:hypothetical protein